MADVVKGGEFWLPPEFLTDDDIFFSKGNISRSDGLCFPSEFPYGFGSSNESESDEEELAGLTRHFSRSTISFPPPFPENKWGGFSGSPQSTLNPAGNWCSVSSNGSPNGPSQFSSPPTTPFVKVDDTWDLISAAAAHVARMKMNIVSPTNTRALLAADAARTVPQPNYSGNCLSHPHSHRCHFHQARPEPTVRQQGCSIWGKVPPRQQAGQIGGLRVGTENSRPLNLHQSAWTTPDAQSRFQNQRPGMGACFSSGSGGVGAVKRECAGTGVFIPRNPSESRKKPAAIHQPRIVQGLNKNFEPIIYPSQAQALALALAQARAQVQFNRGFIPNYDLLIAQKNAVMAQLREQQRLNMLPEVMVKHHEVWLPQEWTY